MQKCGDFSVNCCNFVVTALNKYLLMVLIARLDARARVRFEVRGDWLLSASCTDDVCADRAAEQISISTNVTLTSHYAISNV